LWTGLPLLTQIDTTFAGRVAASLLNAMALQELVAHSREDYEAKAIELGRNGSKLSALKEKVAANRLTMPLFDTQRFTQSIEAAYDAMYRRHQAALPPDHIDIRE
jgi:protein O-GlcNAc transferase